MRNYVQPGEVIDYANSSGAAIAAGDPITIGKRIGVASVDIADGATGSAAVIGVFDLAKVTGAITQGADVYLTAGGQITTTATSNTAAGYAFAAAASADATVAVAINA
ncbi:MAG: DUF2190 family protein [Salinisphaera sp.]|nr:DUF2190 family protein [Salinisphaera sp.]